MDNSTVDFGKIMGGLKEAEGFLNQYLSSEVMKEMDEDQLKQLSDMRKLTGPDLKKAAESLARVNDKHKI